MKNKQSIVNMMILTTGIMISKLLGLIYVFPFSNLVGKEGVALFSYAYIPYSMFLSLASLGIPGAICKIVSKYEVKQEKETIYQILHVAVITMLIIGVFGCVLLILLSDVYAYYILGGSDLYHTVKEVSTVIKIISIAVLFVPALSVLRGYFQGKEQVLPTAISQVLEQLVRVLVILIGSYLIVSVYQGSVFNAIKISVFAASIGGVIGIIVMMVFYRKEERVESKSKRKWQELLKEIIQNSIPFFVFGINFSIYQFVDSISVNKGLLQYGINNPEYVFGIYGFEIQKLVFLPVSLITALGIVLLPKIVHSYQRKERNKLFKMISTNLILVLIYSLFVIIVYVVFSNTIYFFLYDENEIGPNILKSYSILIIVLTLNVLTQIIMQGLDIGRKLCVNLVIGILIKVILNFYLITKMGIDGAILATFCGYFVTMMLNLYHSYHKVFTIQKV